MFAIALENLIKEAMGGHIYSFNGSLRRQETGAAIGTTLSGAIYALYMIKCCVMMKEMIDFATSEIKDFKVKMLKYYVDDGDIISSLQIRELLNCLER